jgi:hypothetical protein
MQLQAERSEVVLWATAIAVAAFGTWVMYEAMPGINWALWTAAAAAGLFLFLRTPDPRPIILTSGTAVLIAFGAAYTASEFIHALIVLSVIMFLALSMLLSSNASIQRITAAFAIPAPVIAFATAITESAKRGIDALHLVRSERARSIVRGIVITAPVIIIFALLLSAADPVFAEWRDAIGDLLSSWAFVPRIFFFVGMLTLTLGAFSYASRDHAPPAPLAQSSEGGRWLGSTERLILIGSIAALFWIFLAVQVSYFFGNLPRVTGSGVTFADYARRGFGELTVVASASVLLVLLSERFGKRDGRNGSLRVATIALIVGVLLLLASAFNRVLLYEAAYGYTTARLYAQCYMIVIAVALLALAWETTRTLQTARLFRVVGATATLVFIVLIYWNHEAWIANRNIDRLATTGKLDVVYLTRDLSANVVPTVVRRLPALPEPARSELQRALTSRYTGKPKFFERKWYEWNLRVDQAEEALRGLGVPIDQTPARPAVVVPAPAMVR